MISRKILVTLAGTVAAAAVTVTAAGGCSKNDLYTEKPLYVFNVIGDMQMEDPNIYDEENYRAALEKIKEISPESKAVISVGDHTDNGKRSAYETLKTIKDETFPDIPLYYAIGNHDRGLVHSTEENTTPVEEWRDRFIFYAKDSSGYDNISNVYYSFNIEDSYFIMLGSEVTSRNDNCNDVFISDEQYDWFDSEMKKASETYDHIFVVIHEPFYDTVSGSLPGQNWQGNPYDKDYYENNRYEDLRNIIDSYPQTIVFSGHTHWSFTTNRPVYGADDDSIATYVNCASVGYLWYDNLTGIQDENNKWIGSEGLFVCVYEDRVEIKGRDFASDKWILDVTVPLKKA